MFTNYVTILKRTKLNNWTISPPCQVLFGENTNKIWHVSDVVTAVHRKKCHAREAKLALQNVIPHPNVAVTLWAKQYIPNNQRMLTLDFIHTRIYEIATIMLAIGCNSVFSLKNPRPRASLSVTGSLFVRSPSRLLICILANVSQLTSTGEQRQCHSNLTTCHKITMFNIS